jgi:hypothetical protein
MYGGVTVDFKCEQGLLGWKLIAEREQGLFGWRSIARREQGTSPG